MKRVKVLVAIAALSTFAVAQTSTQSQTGAHASANANVSAEHSAGQTSAGAQTNVSGEAGNASVASGTTIQAVLTKSIDAKKAKEGQQVFAKTTSAVQGAGETTIPKGAKLIGHVTKASARAKGDSESSLGILFDRADIGKGREVPVHAVIQALAAASTNAAMAMNAGDAEPAGGGGYSGAGSPNSGGGGIVGGTVNGVGHTVGQTAGQVGQTAGNAAGGAVGEAGGAVNNTAGTIGATANSTINANSHGAIGLPGYVLQATAAATSEGSVITSTGKDVKLDSGTQIVLRVVAE